MLYSMGGLAFSGALVNRWQRVLVSLAGPFAGFLFFGLIVLGFLLANLYSSNLPSGITITVWFLGIINVFWGVVNLLPVWPLDGGHVSREFFTWLIPRNGTMISLGVSLGMAAFVAVIGLALCQIFLGLFFGLMAYQSFQLMQLEMNRGSWDDRTPWERRDYRD